MQGFFFFYSKPLGIMAPNSVEKSKMKTANSIWYKWWGQQKDDYTEEG